MDTSLEPSLNPFKAHIAPLMSSYVNTKAITLISLFVGFVPDIKVKNKSLGHSQTFKYSRKSPRLQWEPGQDLKNIT